MTHHPRRVLLALFEAGQPTASLMRAYALSRTLRADLHLLRVLPALTHSNPLFPQNHMIQALEAVDAEFETEATTVAWVQSVLGRPLSEGAFEIRHGNFIEQAAEHAEALDAEFIVLPPPAEGRGPVVTELARLAHRPVLVARAPTSSDSILAASDMRDGGTPVLASAATLGAQLDAPVVAMHNVTPVTMYVSPDVAWPVSVVSGAPLAVAQQELLSNATQRLHLAEEAIVSNEPNPVDAILAAARSKDVDLVVIGTRQRSWLGRLLAPSVADDVIDRSTRSVLVTPLDGDKKPPSA